MALGGGYGSQGRHGQLLRWVRQRYQSGTRYPASALLPNHPEGYVPSHPGDGAQSLQSDYAEQDPERGLRYWRGPAFPSERSAAQDGGSQRPDQDRHHPGPELIADVLAY